MKRALQWILGPLLFVGALWTGWTFRSSNSQSIDLDLIWIRIPNVELWWVLLLAIALGAGLTVMIGGFLYLKNRLLLHRFRAMNRKLEKEVHELRSLPLVGSEPSGAPLDAASPGSASDPQAEPAPTKATRSASLASLVLASRVLSGGAAPVSGRSSSHQRVGASLNRGLAAEEFGSSRPRRYRAGLWAI